MKKITLILLAIVAFYSFKVFTSSKENAANPKQVEQAEISEAFTNIYKHSAWQVTDDSPKSGYGSNVSFCSEYISFVSEFIKKNDIKSVLDLGCGDWTFSQLIDWRDIEYVGIDVVESVISENQKVHGDHNRKFYQMELADALDYFSEGVDLILCKDVLQHLSYQYVQSIVPKLEKANHLLITNDIHSDAKTFEHDMKSDFITGHWHLLDLSKEPFSQNVVENYYLFPSEEGKNKVTQYIKRM
jgi:SAM-dependent methyltransferase